LKNTETRRVAAFAAGALVTALATSSRAEPPGKTPPDESMVVNAPLDLAITLGAAGAWLVTQLSAPGLAPKACRWCDRAEDGTDTLNGFDASVRSAWRWNDTSSANTLSGVFSFGLAPLAGFGVGALVAWHDDRLDELPADALVVAESAMIAMNVNQLVKFVAARQRPDVHARTPAERIAQQSPEDNLSFFSGHATLAFSLATSAGTVASMRHHRLAPLMWTAGLLLAATGGYLRIAADRHYATDVITGAVVGSAVGFSVPYFAHRPASASTCVTFAPVERGATLVFSGRF
jgi:membrane-associated phospholipid phosphatase